MKPNPTAVTAILVIAGVQVVLAWSFYGVFSFTKPESELLPGILRTATAYSVIAIPLIAAVFKRHLLLLRACLVLNVLVSLPVKAVIGIVLSLVSFGLTFRTTSRGYFANAKHSARGVPRLET